VLVEVGDAVALQSCPS